MFAYCYQLKEIKLGERFRLTNAFKYMSNVFRNCTSLVYADLNFLAQFVEDISFMFYGCISLTNISIYASSKYDYHNAKYMNYMFYDCRSLKSISFPYYLNKRFQFYFNISNLQDISYMFQDVPP